MIKPSVNFSVIKLKLFYKLVYEMITHISTYYFFKGFITQYHVQYKDDTIEPPDWKSKMISAPTQQVLIDGLKFFTSYSVKVLAHTVKGPAKNFSMEVAMATLEDGRLK